MQIFRQIIVAFFICLMAIACQRKSGDKEPDHEAVEESPNQALYDEVMRIHDEVMPKMNDLHNAKTSLRTRLELPGLDENERQQIQNKISRIDSASESMMVWMRHFNPIPDSTGEDKARAYLESELVKVKEVEKKILDALKTTATED